MWAAPHPLLVSVLALVLVSTEDRYREKTEMSNEMSNETDVKSNRENPVKIP